MARSGRTSWWRTSAASRVVTWVSSGASAWTEPRWKISPSTEPRSSTLRSASSSWSRRAVSSAFSVGGTSTSSLPAAIASISEMNNGLPPAARAIRSRSSRETVSPISASACSGGSGSSRSVAGQVGLISTSSGRAIHSSSSGAPSEKRRRHDEVEERRVAPLDLVEDDDQRRLLLKQLAERPGDLVGAGRDLRLAQQGADRRCRNRIRRQHLQLFHDLDHRPIGDPLPVRQAAPTHDTSLDPGDRFPDQSGLADTGIADHRDQLAARSGEGPIPGVRELLQLALAADEAGRVRTLARLVHGNERIGGNGLTLALQLEQPLHADL